MRIGAVLRTTVTLLQRHPVGIVLATLGLAVLDSALEIASGDATLSFVGSVVAIAVVYLVLRDLLRREDMVVQEGAFSSYFGASVLSSLGIVVGLLLLIVPGLYLMGRWSLASAMVLTRGTRAGEALRESWEATRACAWKLVLLYTLCFVGWLIVCALLAGGGSLLALAVFRAADAIDTSPVFIFLLNVAVDFGVVAGAYLSVAVYAHVSGSHDGFQDVFA